MMYTIVGNNTTWGMSCYYAVRLQRCTLCLGSYNSTNIFYMYNRSLAQINVQSMHTPKLFLLAKNKNTNEKMENKLNTVYSHQRLMG